MRKMVMIIMLISGFMLISVSPANAWGNMRPCAYHASHTNAWGAYLYHRVNVFERVCEGDSLSVIGPHPHYKHWLKGASTPHVSFSGRSSVPAADSVRVSTKPHLTKVYHSNGHAQKLRYNFVVKKCTGVATAYKVCWERSFRFYVDASFTRLCSVANNGFFGGSHLKCDDRKWF